MAADPLDTFMTWMRVEQGRSLNTLQSSEVTSINRAAESLALSGGGLLLGGLGARLGRAHRRGVGRSGLFCLGH